MSLIAAKIATKWPCILYEIRPSAVKTCISITVALCLPKGINGYDSYKALKAGSPTCGPKAKCGPWSLMMWPVVSWQNWIYNFSVNSLQCKYSEDLPSFDHT